MDEQNRPHASVGFDTHVVGLTRDVISLLLAKCAEVEAIASVGRYTAELHAMMIADTFTVAKSRTYTKFQGFNV